MNTFGTGIIVGFVLFGIMASVIIFNRMQLELAKLAKETDNINKALQMMFLKINKIEKVTYSTMEAAETFVDGLRESADHIQRQMMRPMNGPIHPDAFDDLRQSFEDGIKNMEEGIDDRDEDSEEPDEPWKK